MKKFIDLFAGIGGFHQAMNNFNGECVLASEIDKYCLETYELNYSIKPNTDIRKIESELVPDHDILLGGFPCQTFSKAGNRKGIEDTRGTLFFEIARILEVKKPKYILLENVKNLVSHDDGNTWKVIQQTLNNLGYITTDEPLILSPHQFGIPQLRERVFIPAIHKDYTNLKTLDFSFFNLKTKDDNKLSDILEKNIDSKKYGLSESEEMIINAWDEFKKTIKYETIGFPIWVDYFNFPKSKLTSFPIWKQNIINKNSELYLNNKDFIDQWIKKYSNILNKKTTFRKFEWQAGNEYSSLWECLIQIRPSGIRVKRPNAAPTLVAMVQIPIYGPLRRKLSVRECANLQSFPNNFLVNKNEQQAYKQFGNSVNVTVISKILDQLFKF